MALYPLPQVRPPRQSRPRPLRLFLPLALPFAVLAAIAVFSALTPFSYTPGPPPGTPGALAWGDGLFANTFEVKAWLTLHGASYPAWKRHHPAAVRLLKAQPAKRVRSRAAVPRHRTKSTQP